MVFLQDDRGHGGKGFGKGEGLGRDDGGCAAKTRKEEESGRGPRMDTCLAQR